MTFLQAIEFQGDQARFEQLMDRYKQLMGDQSKARRAWLLADHDRPGTFIELVEFDSFDEAMSNSTHPGTQAWSNEASPMLGSALFRNLDLVQTYEFGPDGS